MAELPELTILQQQMDAALAGRSIAQVEILQEKCLNVPVGQAVSTLTGRQITAVTRRGKWLYLHLDGALFLLLNLGMGADLWHYPSGAVLPEKYQLRIGLDDGTGFTCRFWWFGYIRLLTAAELDGFKETAKLGPSPLAVTAAELAAIARRTPRSTAKSLIMDQEKLSGIGNAYAHDILWEAQIHPQRKLGALTDAELGRYHAAIAQVVNRAISLGGLETDFHRAQGNLSDAGRLFRIGYKEGKPCPRCGTAIAKIQTGSTATFICPQCQTAE
ncbi:MAG TPA: DNA-formamidopyrimidine glycosylase family protein [Symbiobacteriaceae bacterium]|nr:DNA-formamidopyrimidine glycosylase family protein [Symbiobacteriaceae bacterium]